MTALRGFLGLTNYFSEYVPGYAEKAAPLMEKLKLNRQDGKKGSTLALHWSDAEVQAFEDVKNWSKVWNCFRSTPTNRSDFAVTRAMVRSGPNCNKKKRASGSLSHSIAVSSLGVKKIGQRVRKKLTRLWPPFESGLASSGFNRWS